jgi:hypothetical protein
VGIAKAGRIERHLATLLPREVQPARALFGAQADGASGDLVVESVPNVALARPLLDLDSDFQAVQSWIQARAGSLVTVRVYQREAHRLLLWLQYECQGATLAPMSVPDCSAFMAFL